MGKIVDAMSDEMAMFYVLNDMYVPLRGKAATVGGEMARAAYILRDAYGQGMVPSMGPARRGEADMVANSVRLLAHMGIAVGGGLGMGLFRQASKLVSDGGIEFYAKYVDNLADVAETVVAMLDGKDGRIERMRMPAMVAVEDCAV